MAATPAIASEYTFDPFARHQFYHDVNQSLVRKAIGRLDATLPPGQRAHVVELASGTGAVTQLIVEELERLGRPGLVTGVEPSDEAIAIAREQLAGRPAEFVHGDIDDLSRLVHGADAAFFCNAIHLIPDKEAVMEKIAAALGPQGIFACNSSFYTGAYAPGSEKFYHLCTRRSLAWLREHHPELRVSRQSKAMAMQWLTPEEYATLCEGAGLRVAESAQEVAEMPLSSWIDIGNYWLFLEGALPGIPIPIAAQAFEYAATEAFKELDITFVPRVWLQLVAQKG
jgi:ubiquinone/menaquinone biosynthesis C-methylase UbiE